MEEAAGHDADAGPDEVQATGLALGEGLGLAAGDGLGDGLGDGCPPPHEVASANTATRAAMAA
jgi:hypothetical protein